MLTKSDIEYLDFNWPFYTGCEHTIDICPVADKCWAKGNYHRFKRSFKPTFHPKHLLDPLKGKKGGRRIGVNFTGDTFGDWVDPDQKVNNLLPSGIASISMSLKGWVFTTINQCPQDAFIFLTKRPDRLQLWGQFPDNTWVGGTACNRDMFTETLFRLRQIEAKVKFISVEPLMDRIIEDKLGGITIRALAEEFQLSGISWVVIGGYSGGKNPPQIEWIKEIVEAANKAGIPVFLKNNLDDLISQSELYNPLFYKISEDKRDAKLRQEYPKEVSHGR